MKKLEEQFGISEKLVMDRLAEKVMTKLNTFVEKKIPELVKEMPSQQVTDFAVNHLKGYISQYLPDLLKANNVAEYVEINILQHCFIKEHKL